MKCLCLVFRDGVAGSLEPQDSCGYSPGQWCLPWLSHWPLRASPYQLLFSQIQSVTHATIEGLGLTYQTFAGTLCCHVAGNGTWKTLGKEENILEMGVQEVIS